MKPVTAILVLGTLILVAAGCGSGASPARAISHSSDRSVLHSGYEMVGRSSPSPSDAQAKRDVRIQLREWKAGLSALTRPRHPTDLSPHEFRRRLAAAASQYGFTVKSVRFMHAPVLAPAVVVETRHYQALAGAIQRFVPSIVAAHPCSKGKLEYSDCSSVELFFEARDERGVPFLAFGNGQWARSDALYPFIHL